MGDSDGITPVDTLIQKEIAKTHAPNLSQDKEHVYIFIENSTAIQFVHISSMCGYF